MTSDKTLKQAISNITIWRKGEQRAPHKPLLLLYVLSHYRQGHDRLFDYGSEIHEQLLDLLDLLDLLERYGPQRREQRPDMPFWRLRAMVSGNCKTRNSAQPAVAASHLNVNSLNIMLLVGLMPSISRW